MTHVHRHGPKRPAPAAAKERDRKPLTVAEQLARAKQRVNGVEDRQDRVTKRARSDGRISKPERERLGIISERLGISGVHLDVQKAKRKLQNTLADSGAKLDVQQAAARLRNDVADAVDHGELAPDAVAQVLSQIDRVSALREERRELKDALQADLGEKPQPPRKGGPTDLVLSSFNVTGSSHTRPGAEHPEFKSGPERMKHVAELVEKHKVDVVGFQELQGDQLKAFNKLTDNKFGVYPGFKLGKRESVNSIAWNKKEWDLVKPDTIKVPYFNGQKRDMPVVLLRNKETGQKAYFANFHIPADTKRFKNQERFRDAATKLQVQMVNRLREKSGLPVFVTGDMNEGREYEGKMVRGAKMESAHRGPNGPASNRSGIDWIMGTRDVKFTDYVRDRSEAVRKTTNHPMIVTKARIRGGKS